MMRRLRVLKSLRVVLCLAAAWVVVTTLGAIWRLHAPLPTFDHWVAADFADHTTREGLSLGYLWRQHNEHRIAVPRLLFLADFSWFGGRGLFLLAATALFQLAHGILLWRLIRSAAPRAASKAAGAAFLAIALYSAAQMFNLIEPFQVQFVLVHAAATLALWAGVRASDPDAPPAWSVVAILGAAAAALSMANGLLIAPLLVAGTWLRRAPGQRLVLVATAAIVLVGACLFGFTTSSTPELDPTRNVQRPWRILAYAACWVGGPVRLWDGASQVVAGGIAGAVGLLAFLGLALPILWRRRAPPPAPFALALIGTFLCATAFVVALARSGAPLEQAQNDRYATPAHLFWIVVCALGVAHAHRLVRTVAVAAAALIATALVWQQGAHIHRYELRQRDVRLAEIGVLCGVRDEASLTSSQIEGFVGAIHDLWLPALQEHRWSVFARAEHAWLGSKVADHFAIADAAAASAAVDNPEVVATTGWGCRVRGWAWDQVARCAPARVLFAGRDDVIVGFAEIDAMATDAANPGERVPARAAFAGYAAPTSGRLPLRAWIVLADGRACPGPAVPFAAPALAAAAREPIPGTHFLPHGPARPLEANELRPAINSGRATLASEAGRVDVGPLPARAGVVGCPMQVGACNWGLSVHLVDLVTFRQVATIHPPPSHGDWAIWRVDITPTMVSDHLGFIAIDRGGRRGQWIALGQPVFVD